jgi:alkylated DNA repair dioxygenase AlkB
LALPFEYRENFLSQAEAARLRDWLLARAHWRSENLKMFGRSLAVPRRVCWYGDSGVSYHYSGASHLAEEWLRPLADIRRKLQRTLESQFNFVLLNHYRDGEDSMGWHSDDEDELGTEPLIASLSLGATRTFRVRQRCRGVGGRRRSSWKLELANGSLLIMWGRAQSDYQHCVPKSRRLSELRINLTYRYVHPASASALSNGSIKGPRFEAAQIAD